MYWDKIHECMDREQLESLQLERLKATVKRAYQYSQFFKNGMQARGLVPEDITKLSDLSKLPFTIKDDLRDNYPFGIFSSPLGEIVRIHASSGTTGKPTVVGYTSRDLGIWSEVMARTLTAGGVEKSSVVQISFGYGLFTGGLGAHYGAERIGASVIPMSGGNSKRQMMLMKDFGTTALCCTPSYALYLAETMENMGIKHDEMKLKYGIFGAEPWTESMRKEIESRFRIRATDIYGLSEIIGPGVSFECEHQCGMHINEDHFIAEIIDPDTGEVLPHGSEGEIVFTTITKEGMPLIRYRTRDITSISYETCGCGRTLARMKKVRGRSDDMLIIRGVNVYPSQIEEILMSTSGVAPHYLIIVDRVDNLDDMEIHVEVAQDMFSDEVKKIEELSRRISKEIHTTLGINAKLKLVEPQTIQRSEGKAVRVIDKREL